MHKIFETHCSKLGAALAEAGYTQKKQYTLRGAPFRLVFWDPNGMWGDVEEHSPKVELYASAAYPNQKGEIFIHVWNWTGSSMRDRSLMQALAKHGLDTRSTTFRGDRGIAIKVDPEWEQALLS